MCDICSEDLYIWLFVERLFTHCLTSDVMVVSTSLNLFVLSCNQINHYYQKRSHQMLSIGALHPGETLSVTPHFSVQKPIPIGAMLS